MTARRKLRYVSSATILDVLVNEPDGITVSDLAKIVYPESVGTGQFSEALILIGSKIGECMHDHTVEPIDFSQDTPLFRITERGKSIHNMIRQRCP